MGMQWLSGERAGTVYKKRQAHVPPTVTNKLAIFQPSLKGLWPPTCWPEDYLSTQTLDSLKKKIKDKLQGVAWAKQDGTIINTCLHHNRLGVTTRPHQESPPASEAKT